MGEGNEIFVFEMGKPVKIVDLATRMIELAGYKRETILRFNLRVFVRERNCMRKC